jgi:hypothetical protein
MKSALRFPGAKSPTAWAASLKWARNRQSESNRRRFLRKTPNYATKLLPHTYLIAYKLTTKYEVGASLSRRKTPDDVCCKPEMGMK